MKFRCIIFDLDGTLVDTIADIAASMNRALALHGFPPLIPSEYAKIVGWGIKRLALLALPPGYTEQEEGGKNRRRACGRRDPVLHGKAPCTFEALSWDTGTPPGTETAKDKNRGPHQ